MWNGLGEYNPNLRDLSLSAQIGGDPVSVSRFIENICKAFIDFTMTSDNPIGKATHYYCQQEYQGLQHFHFAIWIRKGCRIYQ